MTSLVISYSWLYLSSKLPYFTSLPSALGPTF